MRNLKQSLTHVSHQEALSKLKEYREVKISPVDSLAAFAELFIQEAGLSLTALPKLNQSLQGFQHNSKAPLGAACSFALKHTEGIARLSLIFQTNRDYLLLETIDPATGSISHQHLNLRIHLDDPERMKSLGRKIYKAFRQFDT
ncbi:hypothetical protein [Cohaesibacter haloalkalitolerans]|uniref:hypothetical protein n=1 Tax=Cohaesibacter haloalkalitolerans TaxID=1162980 RepID=UPI000E655B02|nr:hypothetical protein [Cohaesibacter haloalkalitolerans]